MSETAAPSQRRRFAGAETMIAKAYADPKAVSRRFRAKRFEKIMAMIDAIIAEKGRCRIADIGGTPYYWDIASDEVRARPVEITLINPAEARTPDGPFRYLNGDATDLSSMGDMSFDLTHSNSVIEHVGDWAKQKAMAETVRRLAPAYYLQTPYFWFPYEPHFRSGFFHWLPEQIRYRLVMRFALGFADRKATVDDAMARVQSARLLDRKQLEALFPDAEISAERVAGFTKSLIAVRR